MRMAFTVNKDKFEGILVLGCVGDSGGSVERCEQPGVVLVWSQAAERTFFQVQQPYTPLRATSTHE